MKPPGAETIPEQETEPEQGAEHNQPADRPAETQTGKAPTFIFERLCVKVDLSFAIGLNFARVA